MKTNVNAEKAICIIAKREGVTVEEVRRQIEAATYEGLCNKDPDVQARWKKIPRKGAFPTPEELINYITVNVSSEIDTFE